jgi:hypothetical protein
MAETLGDFTKRGMGGMVEDACDGEFSFAR